MYYSEPVPTADPVLPEKLTAPMLLCTEKVYVIVRSREVNKRWLRIEWLPCVTKVVDDVQDPPRTSSFALAPYLLGVQTGRGLICAFSV